MLVDGLIAAFIIALGAVAYYTLMPMYMRAQKTSSEEIRAAQIGQRLCEHLQLLKAGNLNATTLTSLNLIDGGQTSPPYSFTNIPLDDGSYYSPAKALPSGTGTMSFVNLSGNSVMVVLSLSWRAPRATRTLTTGTIVGGYR